MSFTLRATSLQCCVLICLYYREGLQHSKAHATKLSWLKSKTLHKPKQQDNTGKKKTTTNMKCQPPQNKTIVYIFSIRTYYYFSYFSLRLKCHRFSFELRCGLAPENSCACVQICTINFIIHYYLCQTKENFLKTRIY